MRALHQAVHTDIVGSNVSILDLNKEHTCSYIFHLCYNKTHTAISSQGWSCADISRNVEIVHDFHNT